MKVQEALERLKNFNYTALGEGNIVQVYETQRVPAHVLSVAEIHAALEYKVDKRSIRMVDNWTIVIILEADDVQ